MGPTGKVLPAAQRFTSVLRRARVVADGSGFLGTGAECLRSLQT